MQEDNFGEKLGTFSSTQIEFAGRQNLYTLKAFHVVFSLRSRNKDSNPSKKHQPSEKISCLHEPAEKVSMAYRCSCLKEESSCITVRSTLRPLRIKRLFRTQNLRARIVDSNHQKFFSDQDNLNTFSYINKVRGNNIVFVTLHWVMVKNRRKLHIYFSHN